MNERLQALRDLLSEPSQNFAAVGTAVSIVVVMVILVVLALIVAALPGREHDDEQPSEHADEPVSSSKVRIPRWITLVAIAGACSLGIIGAVALWYESTSNNAYCTSTCHAMAEPSRTWTTSAHRNVDCIRCHEGRKWESFPIGVANRTRSLYKEATGRRAGVRLVDEETCLDCHRGLLETPMFARNGEVFKHGDLIKEQRTCLSCHGAQGHTLAR